MIKCERKCICNVGNTCKHQVFAPLTKEEQNKMGCTHPLEKGGDK